MNYPEDVNALWMDVHRYLVQVLNLPTPFKSADPQIGEAMGFLSPQNLISEDGYLSLTGTFGASSSFSDYWAASRWTIGTGVKLQDAIPQIKLAIDGRGILKNFQMNGNITLGNARSPLKEIAGQRSHIWVVDISMPCTLSTVIRIDEFCGLQ